MKKVFWKKLATSLIGVLAVILMVVAAYGIGFQWKAEGMGKITLDNLKDAKGAVGGEIASTTYDLMLSGLIISVIAVALLLISTIFGRLFFALDWILWGGAIFALILGITLLIAGEAYFADKLFHFKDLFKQGMFAAMIICSLVPGLATVGVGAASFQKKK